SVLLSRAPGKTPNPRDFHVGKTLPLHASASGKLFLANLPDERRRELIDLQGGLKRITPRTIIDIEQLEIELARIRESGYADGHRELYETHISAAAPVRRSGGEVVAALCCGGWPAGDTAPFEESILRELVPAAEEFSRVFGQFEPW